MEILDFLKLLRRRKQTLISMVIVFLAVAMLLVVVQPLKYGSSSRLLVSQEFTPGSDAYTISQSNNYLSKLLTQVVGSGSFYNDVMESGYNIDSDHFTRRNNEKEEMEEWNKTVQASSPNTGSGIVNIEVFHPDRGQAEQIAQAVNYILSTRNQEYHDLGENIFLKVIDRPIVSERPVKPDIFLIFPAIIALAIFLAGVYIYFFPEDKYDIKIVPDKSLKKTPFSDRSIKTDADQEVPPAEPVGKSAGEEAKERIPFVMESEDHQIQEEKEEIKEQKNEKPASYGRDHKAEQDKVNIEERGDMRNIFG